MFNMYKPFTRKYVRSTFLQYLAYYYSKEVIFNTALHVFVNWKVTESPEVTWLGQTQYCSKPECLKRTLNKHSPVQQEHSAVSHVVVPAA